MSLNLRETFESGTQESRKGISEIEGKVARVTTSELGSDEFQSRKGISEIEGKTAMVAAMELGAAKEFQNRTRSGISQGSSFRDFQILPHSCVPAFFINNPKQRASSH